MHISAIIEIPKDSCYKYEFDKHANQLIIDRVINQKIPHNYGYIPGTLSDDGDPLDVFVLSDFPIYPLTKLSITIVGAILCHDNGERDDKLLAHIKNDQYYNPGILELQIEKILTYLKTYKDGLIVEEVVDSNKAMHVLFENINQTGN